MGRYEEALTAWKKVIHLRLKSVPVYSKQIACYVALGREEEAYTAAAEVLRLNLNYTLEREAKRSARQMDQAAIERNFDALRKAGLLEVYVRKPFQTYHP